MKVFLSGAALGFTGKLLYRGYDAAHPDESSFSSSSVSSSPGGEGSWLPSVSCYKSIENSLQFTFKPAEVFSARFQPYTLGEVIPITHDVALFRFLLPNPNDEFNLKPCSTLQACYKHGVQAMDQCYRFYTPVTANHTKGYFDIIVKRKNSGLMTTHLFGMHIGDKLLFRNVAFKIQYRPNKWEHIGMIAGGTGFTPMLQIIRHALTEPLEPGTVDKTRLSFLYCNRTENHILLKGLFDRLAKDYPKRFKLFFTVDRAVNEKEWKKQPNTYLGYVTEQMIKDTMPAPNTKNSVIMLCGPDHLLHHVAGTPMHTMSAMSGGLNIQPGAPDLNNLVQLGGVLAALGYQDEQIYRF